MGLGWDMANSDEDAWDLDAIAVLLDKDGQIVDTVYYGHKHSKGVRLDKDNLTGEDEGAYGEPDENIFVNLDEIRSDVVKIGFFANIYNAGYRDFSGVKNAFISMTNAETNQIEARYQLNEKGEGYNAFHFANLDKVNDEWIFTAIGEGTNGDVSQVAKAFSKDNLKANINQSEKKKGFLAKLFNQD